MDRDAYNAVEELFPEDVASDEASNDSFILKEGDNVPECVINTGSGNVNSDGSEKKNNDNDYDDTDNEEDENTCIPYLAPRRRSTFANVAEFAGSITAKTTECVKNNVTVIPSTKEGIQEEISTSITPIDVSIDANDDKSILHVNLEKLFMESPSSSSDDESTIPICSILLQNHLGVESGQFRPGQQEVVLSILQGRNTLAVLPTGWGKSLCYQFPILVHRILFDAELKIWERQQRTARLETDNNKKIGDTMGEAERISPPESRFAVVVSPLLSLMSDQSEKIAKSGSLRSAVLSSAISASREKTILDDLGSPLCPIDLLFISPEKLVRHTELRNVLKRYVHRIAFICVDEVHCVSQWAYDFRPSFMYLHRVLENLTNKDSITSVKGKRLPPFLCLTATAAPSVINDLQTVFHIDRTVMVPYHRDNLKIESISLVEDGSKKPPTQRMLQEKLLEAVLELPKPMLVYVQTRMDAEELATFLSSKLGAAKNGKQKNDKNSSSSSTSKSTSIFTSYTHEQIRKNNDVDGVEGNRLVIRSYHAAIERHIRNRTQQQFMNGSIDVLIATVAFGMGIDKPNIRSVIHASLPSSLENYVQETGRAGRDGKASFCRLLYNPFDYYTLRSRALATFISPAEMLAIVQSIFASPTTKVGEKLAIVSVSKIAEELILSEETVETVLFMLLTQENEVLRELRGAIPLGYRILHASSDITAVVDPSVKRKRGRHESSASGVSSVLAQLEVQDGVLELCQGGGRIEHVVLAANALGLALADLQFRLDDLVRSGGVSLRALGAGHVVVPGGGFGADAAGVAHRLWDLHRRRHDVQAAGLAATLAVLRRPTHEGVRAALEGSDSPDWQPPPRGLTRVEAVQIANDFVEKNRPRIRSVYDVVRALLGVMPKSLKSHGKYAGELPLSVSWYVASPYFGILREFELNWLLKVLAPHKLGEGTSPDNSGRLPVT